MPNLLTLSYWFNLAPGPFLSYYLRIIYSVIGLLLTFGIISGLFIKKNEKDILLQKFWRKIQAFCLTIGIISLLLVFSRQQRIGFIGMPFFLLLTFIGALYWAYRIVNYLTKKIPVKRKEQQQKKEKEKYLKY